MDTIFTAEPYLREIIRRFRRCTTSRRLRRETEDGLSLPGMAFRARPLARLLASTVRRGHYRLSPAMRCVARIEGKQRILYRSTPLDTIVTAVVAEVTSERIRPALSSRVFSYQKGRSQLDIFRDLHRYLRAHHRSRPRAERGLFVLKRDISAYGESIPNHDQSRLWTLLDEVFQQTPKISRSHPGRILLDAMIRREVMTTPRGDTQLLETGVPTGSPVQPMICNLYLRDLDSRLSVIPGAFYARFGDDFLFCHPAGAAAQSASAIIDEEIQRLELRIRPDKKQDYWFTGPGRHSAEWTDARPVAGITHLGCHIRFDGTIGLKKEKIRRLLGNLRRRMQHSAKLLNREPFDVRMREICAVVNRALDVRDPLQERSAVALHFLVNDRGQLKQLDYRIALEIAALLSEIPGVRAFRRVPYRRLRTEGGLISLVASRNDRTSKDVTL